MEKKNTNMSLWDLVCKTNPDTTKEVKGANRKITSVDAQSQRKKATEIFGPYGAGWGIEPGSEVETMHVMGTDTLVTYRAIMFYTFGEIKGRIPINACIKMAFVTNKGKGYLSIDDEYSKKVQTNALTKGLSALGFNSDIFEKKFDDCKYVQQLKSEFTNPLEWVGARPDIKELCSQLKLNVKDIDDAVRDNEFSDTRVISYLKQLASARKEVAQ